MARKYVPASLPVHGMDPGVGRRRQAAAGSANHGVEVTITVNGVVRLEIVSECLACGSGDAPAKYYNVAKNRCDLCGYLSTEHYRQDSNTGAIIKAMCFCTNEILKAIRDKK